MFSAPSLRLKSFKIGSSRSVAFAFPPAVPATSSQLIMMKKPVLPLPKALSLKFRPSNVSRLVIRIAIHASNLSLLRACCEF